MIPEVYYKFLRRWFHVLLIGLLVGAGLGYTFRALSPIEAKAVVGPVTWEWPLKFGSASESGLSFRLVGVTEPRPPLYAGSSAVYIKGSLPSWTYLDPKQAPTAAQQMASLAARAGSRAFLETVSRELPDSLHYGPQELSKTIQASPARVGSMIQITATGPNKEEMAIIAQTAARVFIDQVIAAEKVTAQDKAVKLEEELQDIKRQQDAVQEERLGLLKEPLETAQTNLSAYGEAELAEMLKVTAEVRDALSPLSAARIDTEKRLRSALDRLEGLEKEQRQSLKSEIDRQLGLLAGVSDSDEYIKLDSKIAYLRTQLRTAATSIASLELKALAQEEGERAKTMAEMATQEAQFQTVRGQLDLATGQRDQMVAQARDRVQVDIPAFQGAQQAELVEALESAAELLGPLPAARTDAEAKLLAALTSLQALEKTQRTSISAAIAQETNRLAVLREGEDYLIVQAKAASLQKQFGALTSSIASQELMALASTQMYLSTGEPTVPQDYTPPPPVRQRDSLVFGGGAGLVLAWLAAGLTDFRRNGRHQPPAPAERGPGQRSPRGAGRVRGWLAGLRRKGPGTQPSVLRGPGPGQKSHQKGNS